MSDTAPTDSDRVFFFKRLVARYGERTVVYLVLLILLSVVLYYSRTEHKAMLVEQQNDLTTSLADTTAALVDVTEAQVSTLVTSAREARDSFTATTERMKAVSEIQEQLFQLQLSMVAERDVEIRRRLASEEERLRLDAELADRREQRDELMRLIREESRSSVALREALLDLRRTVEGLPSPAPDDTIGRINDLIRRHAGLATVLRSAAAIPYDPGDAAGLQEQLESVVGSSYEELLVAITDRGSTFTDWHEIDTNRPGQREVYGLASVTDEGIGIRVRLAFVDDVLRSASVDYHVVSVICRNPDAWDERRIMMVARRFSRGGAPGVTSYIWQVDWPSDEWSHRGLLARARPERTVKPLAGTEGRSSVLTMAGFRALPHPPGARAARTYFEDVLEQAKKDARFHRYMVFGIRELSFEVDDFIPAHLAEWPGGLAESLQAVLDAAVSGEIAPRRRHARQDAADLWNPMARLVLSCAQAKDLAVYLEPRDTDDGAPIADHIDVRLQNTVADQSLTLTFAKHQDDWILIGREE